MSERKCLIVDIDGVLANNEHRLHFIKGGDKKWDEYNERCSDDAPIGWSKEIVKRFFHVYEIILVTGRSDDIRIPTTEWLREHEIPYDKLFMRATGDFRQDYLVKKEIYFNNIMDEYEPLFVLEDRQQVVHMWRELGLVCLQNVEGKF